MTAMSLQGIRVTNPYGDLKGVVVEDLGPRDDTVKVRWDDGETTNSRRDLLKIDGEWES